MSIIGITVAEEDMDHPVPAMQVQQDESDWEALARHVKDGTYKAACEPGDTFPVHLGRFGDFEAQIVAMDTDWISGSDRMAALSFLLTGLLPKKQDMNPEWAQEDPEDDTLFLPGTGAVNGWMDCGLRKWLNEEVLPEFPEIIRENMVAVQKISRIFTARSQVFDVMTADKLWIPSRREVFGPGRFTELTGPVYDAVFKDNESRIMCDADGDASWWWLRSANHHNTFYTVYTSGSFNTSYSANYTGGVAVGFCFGSGI